MASGTTLEVAMNEVRVVSFQTGPFKCIGTRNLNGCTAVTIASPYAAVLAHIAPRAFDADPNDVDAGDNNCKAKMDQLVGFYNQYKQFFPPGRTTWVISALYRGQPALPDQRRIIEEKLQQADLTFVDTMYLVLEANEPRGPEKGTVLIDARNEGQPMIYVEGQVVHQ